MQKSAGDRIQTGRCGCCGQINPDPAGFSSTREEAARVRKLLHTKGWKIIIFHNLHWVWSLRSGPISLHKDDRKYHCLFSFDMPGAGECVWTDKFSHHDPNKAVQHQIQSVCNHLNRTFEQFYNFMTRFV